MSIVENIPMSGLYVAICAPFQTIRAHLCQMLQASDISKMWVDVCGESAAHFNSLSTVYSLLADVVGGAGDCTEAFEPN